MENQVANLRKKGVKCDFLSSVKTAQERSSILQDVKSACPTLRLLFITPELLSTEGFMGTLKAMNSKGTLTLFAVDEAHCISSWCVKHINKHKSFLSLELVSRSASAEDASTGSLCTIHL